MIDWGRSRLLGLILLLLVAAALIGCTRDKPPLTPGSRQTPLSPSASDMTSVPLPGLTPAAVSSPSTDSGQDVSAPATSTPAPQTILGEGNTYTVQRNDTLFNISQRFNTDVETMKNLNGLTGDSIYVGQVLRVPGEDSSTASGTRTYRIQSGDRLGDIAARFGVSISDLIRANDIEDADHIVVGQVLTIPGEGEIVGEASVGERTYQVQQGDSLNRIAVRFGVTVQDIIQANNITDPDTILPGQVLHIP